VGITTLSPEAVSQAWGDLSAEAVSQAQAELPTVRRLTRMEFVILTPERQRQYIALGRLVAEFGQLDLFLTAGIAAVAEIPFGVAQSMFAGESTETLLRILDSVFTYKVKDDKLKTEYAKYSRRLKAIILERNTHIHALWFITDKDIAHKVRFVKGKRGKPLRWDSADVKITDLERLVEDIIRITGEFWHFIHSNFRI